MLSPREQDVVLRLQRAGRGVDQTACCHSGTDRSTGLRSCAQLDTQRAITEAFFPASLWAWCRSTPAQIATARKMKKFFTGRLDTPVYLFTS